MASGDQIIPLGVFPARGSEIIVDTTYSRDPCIDKFTFCDICGAAVKERNHYSNTKDLHAEWHAQLESQALAAALASLRDWARGE